MNPEKAKYLAENMELRSRTDRLWLNNPVVMQGLGLAPLVVAATTGRNALILAMAVALLLTPTRLAGALLGSVLPRRFSIFYYAGVACLLYIPIYYACLEVFGVGIRQVGIYLPLLVMDQLTIRRYAQEKAEKPLRALRRGIAITVGYGMVLLLVGFLREFLAAGTLLDEPVLSVRLFPLAAQPAGGFLLVGAICAAWRGCIRWYKKHVNMEAKRGV